MTRRGVPPVATSWDIQPFYAMLDKHFAGLSETQKRDIMGTIGVGYSMRAALFGFTNADDEALLDDLKIHLRAARAALSGLSFRTHRRLIDEPTALGKEPMSQLLFFLSNHTSESIDIVRKDVRNGSRRGKTEWCAAAVVYQCRVVWKAYKGEKAPITVLRTKPEETEAQIGPFGRFADDVFKFLKIEGAVFSALTALKRKGLIGPQDEI